jgi:hypothetical protein
VVEKGIFIWWFQKRDVPQNEHVKTNRKDRKGMLDAILRVFTIFTVLSKPETGSVGRGGG